MTPEISIVVPVYNGTRHLRETLDALLAQTFKNFELVVIDDGSTDGSSDLVNSIKDERIRLVRQKNGGLCDALNRGIQEARAPYIARNDQDDISLPQRLERQLNVLQSQPDALGLFSYYTKFGAKRGWSNADKMVMAPGEIKDYEPLKDGCLLGSTMFARTAALRDIHGFRQAYYPCDDWDLEFRLAQAGRVLVLREALVAYRFHTSANTYRLFAEMQNKSRWTVDSYERRLRQEPEQPFQEFLAAQPADWRTRFTQRRLDMARLHMRLAGQHYLDGRYLATATRLFAAILFNPQEILWRVRRMRHSP